MSIASEITRLQGAKADLATAIEGKGVTVPSATKLDGYADLVDAISQGGGGGTLGTKTITANGTYNASSDGYDGYSEVTANVPNTYSASDEGKVVSNGALVAQTSDTVTANDTYDTTLINSLTVNVSGGGDIIKQLEELTELVSDEIFALKTYWLTLGQITRIYLPNATSTGQYGSQNAFRNLTQLLTIVTPRVEQIPEDWCRGSSKLTSIDLTNVNKIWNRSLRETKLDTLVIRAQSVPTLVGANEAFSGTPFASNGTGGTLYVPNDLIASYQAASNWSTILGYANNQIKSIESTHTDPTAPIDLTLYYADGTLIPT